MSLSPATIRAYEQALNRADGGKVPLLEHLKDLAADGYSLSTMRMAVAAYAWDQGDRDISKRPEIVEYLGFIARGTEQRVDKKYPLLPDQVKSVLDQFNARDQLILVLGMSTGMRRSEIVAARYEHVAETGRSLFIPRAKQGSRTVSLTRQVVERLDPEGEGWIFPGVCGRHLHADHPNRVCKRVAALCGLDPANYGAHSMRAGFIVAAMEMDTPLYAIMQQTGHKDPATTFSYTQSAHVFETPEIF